ncbi:MAG: prepilin peptidase [Pirellulales bacterium]
MDLNAVVSLGLVAMVGIAAATDIGHRKIPNVLTVTGFVFALLVRGLIGFEALIGGFLGASIGFALFLPLFAVGGLGGGDVKLPTATGAFLGPKSLIVAVFATVFIGAAMAVIAAARQRALTSTLLGMRDLVVGLAQRAVLSKAGTELPTLDKPGGVRTPYGVAIAAGALIGLLWGDPIIAAVLGSPMT